MPEGWAWAPLLQCSALVIDCKNKTAPYTTEGIPIVRTTNVRDGELRLDGMKYVSEEIYELWSMRCKPAPGDLLITREAPMGEACIIPENMQLCLGQRMMLARFIPGTINSKYLLYSFMEPGMMERVQDKPVGATVQHLRVGGIESLLIPLPPLPEQHRIAAKVDELMALCDQLEHQLGQAEKTSRGLLESALMEALRDQS
jgi:type I restriction enzyme S subunit